MLDRAYHEVPPDIHSSFPSILSLSMSVSIYLAFVELWVWVEFLNFPLQTQRLVAAVFLKLQNSETGGRSSGKPSERELKKKASKEGGEGGEIILFR